MNGGARVAGVLERHGVRNLFTLCGGHISPILVEAKRVGIRVVDVRHEADAVFAADAVARLTGEPGVAAVTAGPGATNTITAIKNAQLAQSPVVLLGGATATVLKGRGSLQDIDQMALLGPHVKWATSVGRVRDLEGALTHAFADAREGVPGPVFVEVPVDLLYPEKLVRGWYGAKGGGKGLAGRLLAAYLRRHLGRVFRDAGAPLSDELPRPPRPVEPSKGVVARAAARLGDSERPVLLVGSQATLEAATIGKVADAVEALGVPVYLSGMARGLLGRGHPLQMRHKRREALREADLVLTAGVPFDFRLDYGRHIRRGTPVVAVNRSRGEMTRNRRPDLAVHADPGRFLMALAADLGGGSGRSEWLRTLRRRDEEREAEIERQAAEPVEGGLNPLAVCRAVEECLADDSVIVADGGDFVATASYIVSPRAPLSWLDPGVFGTLGVGGGFALGAALCRPGAEVWLLWGDGSAAYSLAELDTFCRHGIPVVAVVGNDAGWTQIAREQVEVLGDDVGTVLASTDYHRVAEGYGAVGLDLGPDDDPGEVLRRAKEAAASGRPVLVNARLGRTEFRKGSISM